MPVGIKVLLWCVTAFVVLVMTGLVGFVAWRIVGKPAEWRDYNSPGGGYRVELPAEPIPNIAKNIGLPDMQGATAEGTTLRGTQFVVIWVDIPNRGWRTEEQIIEATMQGALAGGDVVHSVRGEPFRVGGFPAQDLELKMTNGENGVLRVIVADTRLYVLTVGGFGINPKKPDAQRFLNSFEITDPRLQTAAKRKAAEAERVRLQAEQTQQQREAEAKKQEAARLATEKAAEEARPLKLQLPPLPDSIEISPAPIEKETSYKLPEPARSLRVGGGGRFLILHFSKARKLAVFDANEAKIVRDIAVPDENVLFAAGMTKLVVVLPGSKEIHRYNLLTGEREDSGTLSVPEGKIEDICMGHASTGPLVVNTGNGAWLFDIDLFKRVPVLPAQRAPNLGREEALQRLQPGRYWAGATGRVLGHTGTWGQPSGVNSVVFEDGQYQRFGKHLGTWFVMPGPDDEHLYPAGFGVINKRTEAVKAVPFSMGAGSGYASHVYLPAHHGPYYLHAQTIASFAGKEEKTPAGTIRLFVLGDEEPIATFANTAVCKYENWQMLRGLGLEYSLHLIPKAQLLVVVSSSRDELRLYPVDLEATLEKSERDYLIFTSSPPTRFEKGKPFVYQGETKTKMGPVTFNLERAPKGMTANESGLVQWSVPTDFTETQVEMTLVAKNRQGRVTSQTITLTVAASE